MKYVLYGYDKIKNEKVGDNEKDLFEFINDLEKVNKINKLFSTQRQPQIYLSPISSKKIVIRVQVIFLFKA